jgi:hypothetical protein
LDILKRKNAKTLFRKTKIGTYQRFRVERIVLLTLELAKKQLMDHCVENLREVQ